MATSLKHLFGRLKVHDAGYSGGDNVPTKQKGSWIFPTTDPEVDGEECLHDCASCSVKYPDKFKIDQSDNLYGHLKPWARHLVVATGKTDWVRNVADEKGSIMEAVDGHKSEVEDGRLMLSASNMPIPDSTVSEGKEDATTVLLLPAFTIIENVTPATVPDLIKNVINASPTNTTSLANGVKSDTATQRNLPESLPLKVRSCPHDYLILMCSQKTRDARCGQSAPLLRKEFERQLRPLGLWRDMHDERPGGVGVYFISHVGGHKYSANVMVYRKYGTPGTADANWVAENGEKAAEKYQEAGQCIWLARVRPEDCENIVRYTVLQGKVVKPETQLRGGFDRCQQLVSW